MPGKRKLKSKLRLVLFIVLLFCLFGGGFALANNLIWPLVTGDTLVGGNSGIGNQDLTKLPGFNVLMLGIDQRGDDPSKRTDTMILANINNKTNRVSLLSIPRDTKVSLPGHGTNKINDACYFGGPQLAMQTVSDLTGVPVDYYVLTNFNGFKDIVDALGGVTIDVETDMNHSDPQNGGEYNINLHKGLQKLNGTQALMFVRYRSYPQGDITRTKNQLKLLTAIGDEVMQPSSIGKLPKLVPSIYKNVETNMGLTQMLTMAKAVKDLNSLQMVSQTLPGYFLNEQGVSYWYVDPQKAKDVTMALFENGTVSPDVVEGAMGDASLNTGKAQVAAEPQPSAGTKQSTAAQSDAGSSQAPATGDTGGDAAGAPDATVNPDATANPAADNTPASSDAASAGDIGAAPNPGADAGNNGNVNSGQDAPAASGATEAAPPSAASPPAATQSPEQQPPQQTQPQQQQPQEQVTITVN